MTRHTTYLTIILFSSLLLASCSKSEPAVTNAPAAASPQLSEDKHIRSVDVVKATAQPVEVSPGGSGEAVVRLVIQSGYHINANPPTYPYLKATELEITPGEEVSAGAPTYPKPVNRKFAFAEKPLGVYEGETEVKVELKAGKSAKAGQHSLAAKLRIQACDEAVCYPPGSLDLVIPVNIK
jgi:hypothetical protein